MAAAAYNQFLLQYSCHSGLNRIRNGKVAFPPEKEIPRIDTDGIATCGGVAGRVPK